MLSVALMCNRLQAGESGIGEIQVALLSLLEWGLNSKCLIKNYCRRSAIKKSYVY